MEVSRIATPQMLRKVFNTHIEHGTADKMSVEQVLVLCEKVEKD